MRKLATKVWDIKGVGGFMEAIIAIMVISAAVALVVITVPQVGTPDQGVEELEIEARRTADYILAVASEDGLVIDSTLIYKVKGNLGEPEEGHGLRASLRILSGTVDDILIVSSGALPDSLEGCYVLREPVGYSSGGNIVQAALLVVMVWG